MIVHFDKDSGGVYWAHYKISAGQFGYYMQPLIPNYIAAKLTDILKSHFKDISIRNYGDDAYFSVMFKLPEDETFFMLLSSDGIDC